MYRLPREVQLIILQLWFIYEYFCLKCTIYVDAIRVHFDRLWRVYEQYFSAQPIRGLYFRRMLLYHGHNYSHLIFTMCTVHLLHNLVEVKYVNSCYIYVEIHE